jgi:hypothetical protein
MRDHFYWGFCTLLFVFLPFLARLAMFLFINIQWFLKKYNEFPEFPNKTSRFRILWKESSKLIWQLPPLTIIRFCFNKSIKIHQFVDDCLVKSSEKLFSRIKNVCHKND